MDDIKQIDKQLELEDEMMGLGISRYRAERMDWHSSNPKQAPESEMRPGITLMRKYLDKVSSRIADWTENAPSKAGKYKTLQEFLKNYDPDVVAFITIKRCINALSTGDTLNRVSFDIAKMLIDEYEYRLFRANNPGYYRVVWDRLLLHSESTLGLLPSSDLRAG